MGIERAGFDIALAIDYDGHHVATHERNFPYGKSVCASVGDLDGEQLREMLAYDGEVDLIFGGPPCQGFSNMGLRDTHDPRNSLVFHYARIVTQMRPKAFIMENVPGLNMGKTAEVFQSFLGELGNSYNMILPVKALTATEFGVPQARSRLFVVGIRKDIGSAAEYPAPSGEQPPSVAEAIGDLPEIEDDDELFRSDIADYGAAPNKKLLYARRARGTLAIPNDYGRGRIWDKDRVSGCQRTKHSEETRSLYLSTEPGQVVPGHKLPRLDPDGICPTLRAGATSERGSYTAPRPIHPKDGRVITAREAARLHGYPDWFSFFPAKVHTYRQIGNSVCPPVAHSVGLKVIEALGIDPKTLPRDQVVLKNEFNLPKNRPLQHARIPVKVEYPKIFNFIWDRAYNEKTGELAFTEFGARDIKEAIETTGAKLPRVRPERFLYEAGQQRAIRDILSLPMSHGYSIAIIDKDTGSGRFQPVGQPGSLGRPTAVVIKSADLRNTVPIHSFAKDLNDSAALIGIVENPEFVSRISGGNWTKLTLARDLFSAPISPWVASISSNSIKNPEILVLQYGASQVQYDRVETALNKSGHSIALVLLQLTTKHLCASLLSQQDGVISEDSRVIFVLEHQLTSGYQKYERRRAAEA